MIIYKLTGNVENCSTIIFNKTIYSSWYKYLRTRFSPILVNTSQTNVHFLNQMNGKFPRRGVIDQETININDLCYQCYKHGPDCLFGKLRMNNFNDEPHFPNKNINIRLNQNEYVY